ncbi:Vesicle-associated protein 2-1 [Stylosanthes scabra]|uniref:Vesicle-associated protein 2-1 n=1 Tax=Stylosanthes scabra TaxID=79078 RepID=A0ABU6UEK0_9FABA|nr:Vesicle-associated protein 2-1 [Stylosanthes scabra]
MTTPAAASASPLISVSPDELRFPFELEKQSFCDLKVVNNTQNYVAFKVKTTSPKKYFVRPNTGVIQPWDSCIIRAQREYPPDMQCKDKFLLQSTVVNPNTDVDDLPADTFSKESGNATEELKLRVAYIASSSIQGSSEDDALKNSTQKLDSSSALQQLKEERDAAARQTRQLQQELDMLKRRRNQRGVPGFSIIFAIFVGLIGLVLGFLLKPLFSSPSPSLLPSTE